MKKKKKETPVTVKDKSKTKNLNKVKNTLKRKNTIHESTLSKKNFRENPNVEKLYKTVHDYKLREEAYKTAIEIHLNRLLKANPGK